MAGERAANPRHLDEIEPVGCPESALVDGKPWRQSFDPSREAYGGLLLGGTDHLRHTHDIGARAFTRGCAATGGYEVRP